MQRQRVHFTSTVNAGAVSKAGGRYTVRGVCGAVDGIVMNSILYDADELARGALTLNGKPAPAGHPKNAAGQYISATSGDALLNAYAGAVCRNARHEGGRTLVDIEVNEAQARAHPDGAKLVERLDAAINGDNTDPIHVSTGLLCQAVEANGESKGKKYTRKATAINYDHLAFLLHEQGAGTPEQGVGMFLNSDGTEEPVEVFALNATPEDRRAAGVLAWARQQLRRLLGNSADDLSFDVITDQLYKGLPEGAWLREVFDRYAVWAAADGKLYRQDYSITSDGSVAWAATPPEEVRREVSYVKVNTTTQEHDPVKPLILAALNAAGVKTEGLDDDALLAAYNALARRPAETALAAANAKVAEFEQAQLAAQNAERDAIATELATNAAAAGGTLTVDDYKAMPLAVLKKLQGTKGAAHIVVGNAGATGADKALGEFKGYSLNSFIDDKKAA